MIVHTVQRRDDSEYSEIVDVFEGPDDADVAALREAFMSNFDYRTLGRPKYPRYKGPMTDMYAEQSGGSGLRQACPCCWTGSPSILSGEEPVPDTKSPEYKRWLKARDKVDREWQKQRDARLKQFRQRYGGKDEEEMFLNYLVMDCGFKRIESKNW